jgi:AcrR family transcriptional regulator
MKKVTTTDIHKDVNSRSKILAVAEKLFAEKGFASTSIRDITTQAGCNLAAVNYHFGGKDNLYLEVFRHHMEILRDQRIAGIQEVLDSNPQELTLEILIRAFARAFWKPLMNDTDSRLIMQLLTREMLDLHLPKGMFLRETIIPVKTALKNALLQICPELEEYQAELCIHSIIGQLVHVMHSRKMFEGVENANLPYLNLNIALDHIATFSAAGIRGYLKENNP